MDNCCLKNCLPGCFIKPMLLAILTSILFIGCSSNVEKTTIYFGGDILTMSDSADKMVAAILIKNGKNAARKQYTEIGCNIFAACRCTDV
jgi:hypothetical protein